MKNLVLSMIAGMAAAEPDVSWDSIGEFKMSKPAFLDITSFHNSD